MHKTRWGFFLLIFALGLALVVSGCSGVKKTAKPGEKVIRIAFIGPLTGDMKTSGESAKNAFNLAVEQAGGIVGDYKIETVTADDCNDATEAANAASKLITQEKVKAIVGSLSHKTTLSVSQVANDNKVVMITGAATNPKVTSDNGIRKDFVFRSCFIDPLQGTVAAGFAAETLKAKTAAVLYNREDEYYNTCLANSFKDAFTTSGGKVIAFESYSRNNTDLVEALNSIAGQKPDVLYLPDHYQMVSLIAKQARDKNINAIFLGGDGWDSTDYDSSMEGGYFTNHFSASDPRPEVKKWVEDYRTKYGSFPDARATLYYDATNLLLNAIKVANSDDPSAIKDALQATKDFPAISGKISFDNDGNPVKPAAILQVKGGKQVYVTTLMP